MASVIPLRTEATSTARTVLAVLADLRRAAHGQLLLEGYDAELVRRGDPDDVSAAEHELAPVRPPVPRDSLRTRLEALAPDGANEDPLARLDGDLHPGGACLRPADRRGAAPVLRKQEPHRLDLQEP